MEEKIDILNFSIDELEKIVSKKFQAKQIYQWIYQKYANDFSEFSNLSKKYREELSNKYQISSMKIIKKEFSADKTVKYLFQLHDKTTVETVLLNMSSNQINCEGETSSLKWTICVSTQVGCKVGCAFCLTAKNGFIRNLTAGEIVGQILNIKKDNNIPANKSVNIVYMGMGEPLDNLDNLVKVIKILKDENGLSISPRRQTVSTSGISSKIDKLGFMDLGVHLAISLHAVDDEIRTKLIPINKAYNIQSIIEAVKRFPYNRRKRVMFEYLVMKNLNDSLADAKKLLKLLNGIKAKVNLIYFNPYPGTDFERPTEEQMEQFAKFLNSKGLLATIRSSRGIDISAACGQLQHKESLKQ